MFLFSVLVLKAETRRQRRSRFESCKLFVLSYDDARYISIPISRPSYSVQFSLSVSDSDSRSDSERNWSQILRLALSARGRMGTSLGRKCGVFSLGFFFRFFHFFSHNFEYRESRVAASVFVQIYHMPSAMNTS